MNEHGKILFKTENINKKNGVVFITLGLILLLVSSFVFTKIIFYVGGTLFILYGLYLVLIKKNDGVIIYEKAILLLGNLECVIKKSDIESISYKPVKLRRNPIISYYPILLLKDGSLINLTIFFNKLKNQNLEIILKEYLSN